MTKRSFREVDGVPELNEDMLKGLRLRRIIKENHSQSINQLVLNGTAPDLRNLVATVGGRQANVYDNEHHGDHLDLVSHYNGREKQELISCCWLPAVDDALLAAGSVDGSIHLISLTQSCVLRVLEGHTGAVVEVFSSRALPELLFSCARDDTLRVWHVESGRCVAIFEVKGTAAAVDDTGKRLVVGQSNGEFCVFDVPADLAKHTGDPVRTERAAARVVSKRSHGASIDSLAFVDDDRVLSKSVNGRLEVWRVSSGDQVVRFALKGSAGNNHCRFGLSADRRFVAVGDAAGVVAVFDIEGGREVVELRHRRSRAAVRSCAFGGPANNSVLFASADSIIWRYDYVDEATLAEWDKKNQAAKEKEEKEKEKEKEKEDENKRP